MPFKQFCPKCKDLTAIRYGKIRLKNGASASRIRCKNCRKTFFIAYRHPFFNKMRTSSKEFHQAIVLYIRQQPIKLIAKEMKKRPNTIIDWVKKVCDNRRAYSSYLKHVLDYNDSERAEFFLRLGHSSYNKTKTKPTHS